jgi:hypothetical protein
MGHQGYCIWDLSRHGVYPAWHVEFEEGTPRHTTHITNVNGASFDIDINPDQSAPTPYASITLKETSPLIPHVPEACLEEPSPDEAQTKEDIKFMQGKPY